MECVASVRKLTYPNIHIVIVDNGSTDDSVAILKQNYPEVRVIVNATNLGFAAGNNIGIRYALSRGADYVLLLNNDTIVAPDMLENMVAAGEAVPQIGILAPKIYYYKTQKLWRAGGRRRKLTLGATDTGIGREDDKKYNIPREIDYAFGSGMLIKREVFEQVGLFDEGYFMYYEDCDLCIRAQKRGYSLFYVPTAHMWHKVAASTGRNSPAQKYHRARSSVRFFAKNTHGFHFVFIVLYRLASVVWNVTYETLRGNWRVVRPYLQGLLEGLVEIWKLGGASRK